MHLAFSSRSRPLDNTIVRIATLWELFRTVSRLLRTCVAGCTCRIAYSSYRHAPASGRTSRKLLLIYNRGSPTCHDSKLPRNKRLRVRDFRAPTTMRNFHPLLFGPIRRDILLSVSTPFLTFTGAFLKYGTTFRGRSMNSQSWYSVVGLRSLRERNWNRLLDDRKWTHFPVTYLTLLRSSNFYYTFQSCSRFDD